MLASVFCSGPVVWAWSTRPKSWSPEPSFSTWFGPGDIWYISCPCIPMFDLSTWSGVGKFLYHLAFMNYGGFWFKVVEAHLLWVMPDNCYESCSVFVTHSSGHLGRFESSIDSNLDGWALRFPSTNKKKGLLLCYSSLFQSICLLPSYLSSSPSVHVFLPPSFPLELLDPFLFFFVRFYHFCAFFGCPLDLESFVGVSSPLSIVSFELFPLIKPVILAIKSSFIST